MGIADVRNILVVKLSSLGDIVHVTPSLRVLRRHWPRARIVMAVERQNAAVVRHNPHLDEIIEVDPRVTGWLPRWFDVRRRLSRLVAPRFDLAIDFQGRWRSALWVYASRANWQAGRGDLRPGWHTVIRPDLGQHAIHVCNDVCEALGVPVHDLEPEVFLNPRATSQTLDSLTQLHIQPGQFLLVNPFSRWRSKEWPLERYAELIRRLNRTHGLPIIITGGPDRWRDSHKLLTMLPADAALSLVGQITLEQAMCLYAQARLMITGDSGPMHLAAALGTRVVALFGPTFPERTGPWGKDHIVIQKKRPGHHHAYREDASREHISAIDVDTVADAVCQALEQPVQPRTAA